MLYTDNIGLKKPAYSEPADIADLNENSDIIDREFGNRYLKSETYSVEQANNAIAQAIEALPNGLVYRGAVNYYKDLPTANNELGDTYSVKYQGETGTTADGNEYAWGEYDGTLQWIKLGVNAYTKNEIDEQHEAIKSDISSAEKSIIINQSTIGFQSKNILPNVQPSTAHEGITYTVNADKSITCNGTTGSTASYFSLNSVYTELPDNIDVVFSGCPAGGSANAYALQLYEEASPTNKIHWNDYGGGITGKLPKTNNGKYKATIVIRPNQTVENLTFYPMLRYAGTDNTYVPYVPTVLDRINALIERIQALETAQTQNE